MQKKISIFMETVNKMTLGEKQDFAQWIVYMYEPTAGYPAQMEFRDNLIIIAEADHDSAPLLTVKDVTEYIAENEDSVMELDWDAITKLAQKRDPDMRWVIKAIAAAGDPEEAERCADILKEADKEEVQSA
jgi:hypothetical protein